MKEIDRDGKMLCAMQGKIFECSVTDYGTSSPVFIRRFMNSKLASAMDSAGFLERPFSADAAFDFLNIEYGESNYGVTKYSPDIMYWMGYIYRYWAYACGMSSKQVFHTIGSRELKILYYAYHTMDPSASIQRIMEAKDVTPDKDLSIERGVAILKKIRKQRGDS